MAKRTEVTVTHEIQKDGSYKTVEKTKKSSTVGTIVGTIAGGALILGAIALLGAACGSSTKE